MWLFGELGVSVYSPDGTDRKHHIDGSLICDPKADFDGPSYKYCSFEDIVSDGKKYVWAAVHRGRPTIDVFDINTASVVGSFDTCEGPTSLEYHPLREEIWVRCSDVSVNSTLQSNLDVFSAISPTGDVQVDILMKDRALHEDLSSNGYSVVHNTLGDVGFLTDTDLPSLFKIDLSEKVIVDKFELSPLSHGLNEAVYSPVNRHIFVRSEVCCTCGFEGADLGDSCGRSSGYNVTTTTGPFQ